MPIPSIPSQEILGKVEVQKPVAPRHTEIGHEACAYYDMQQVPGDPLVECQHGFQVHGGALYSEDYVKQLVVAGQNAVARVGELDLLAWHKKQVQPALDQLKELVDGK